MFYGQRESRSLVKIDRLQRPCAVCGTLKTHLKTICESRRIGWLDLLLVLQLGLQITIILSQPADEHFDIVIR